MSTREAGAQACKQPLLTVIVKTVNRCNLACDYCYVRSHQGRSESAVIPEAIVDKMIGDYADLARVGRAGDTDHHAVKITWHGGEPLLAGLKFFDHVIRTERPFLGSSVRVVNSITTNGTLIDDEVADFLGEHKFQVGISLDGPREIHDSHRRDSLGVGSFDATLAAIGRLRRRGIPFGLLSVVTKELADRADEFFQFVIDNGFKNLAFIPYTTRQARLGVSEYSRFLCRFFDLWYDRDDPDFYVRDFSNVLQRLFGREASLCEYNNCFGNYLGLDTNGDIYMCDLLIGEETMLLGNIASTTWAEIIDSSSYTELQRRARTLPSACRACDIANICTGGCLYRRYLRRGVFPAQDVYCSVRKRFIRHVADRLAASADLASARAVG